ncbi:VanZ family protein [Niallia sp. Man26]|uniref:VanZ family protein n=1 Tax=Niallia sp. Man26 TaxID=2912824 RepID=UPI001EDB5A61|nr:VanZ family protein [Niallia sp. Man26]UPO90668.1 VanZ family protein [Niallia sp. Man26]
MYAIYDIVFFGTIFLIIYIVVDFIRMKTSGLMKRLITYSFLYYLLHVAQLTTGGIILPPQHDFLPTIQLVPFYFIKDWYNLYHYQGFDWFFWNSVKLSFYNLIMLCPLGVYISLLFKARKLSKAIGCIFLVSVTIEVLQLLLGYVGIVEGRAFDVDDLLLNTIGGGIGYIITEAVKKKVRLFRQKQMVN